MESYFINQFKSKYIGDDGAILDGKSVVVQDAFFENIHFKREWFSLDEIAYKSVAVNVSDIYSMNATPQYGLLTVAIPKNYSKSDLQLLASGFKRAEKDFKFEIVGGDTISNSKLDISVTVIGKLRGKPILRSGAKSGDFVAYTERLGSTKRDLEKLLKGRRVDRKSRFIKPQLQREFIYRVAKYINSGLDISDGLFSELQHISKSSRVGFRVTKKIPRQIGCSGEEYQLLFTYPRRNSRIIKAIAKNLGVKITVFAQAIKGRKYQNRCNPHHF
jgi:thiamine-monophosphate kinase